MLNPSPNAMVVRISRACLSLRRSVMECTLTLRNCRFLIAFIDVKFTEKCKSNTLQKLIQKE